MSANLISFLEEFKPIDGVQTLLRDIVLLQAKFDENAKGDLFFQTSKEMQAKLLNLGKEKYAKLVEIANESSLEQLNLQLEKVRTEIKTFTSEHEMNSITGQKVNSLNTQIDSIKLIIEAKEKYDILKPLDELMKDEQGLIKLFKK